MFTVSAVTSINRPIDDVFDYVSDPHNQQDWQPGLHEVTLEGDTHTEVRKIMGRRVAHILRRVAHEKNKHIRYEAKGRGHETEITTTYTFSSAGPSTTIRLELEIDTKGMLKSGEPTMVRILQREIRSDLEHLKDLLEAHEDLRTVMEAGFEQHGERRPAVAR